jgi:hypothetical protein
VLDEELPDKVIQVILVLQNLRLQLHQPQHKVVVVVVALAVLDLLRLLRVLVVLAVVVHLTRSQESQWSIPRAVQDLVLSLYRDQYLRDRDTVAPMGLELRVRSS